VKPRVGKQVSAVSRLSPTQGPPTYQYSEPSTVTRDIVAKLWSLCDILKDDGVTYHEYVTELTYLLFLKMAKETNTERAIPRHSRWDALKGQPPALALNSYRGTLRELGAASSQLVRAIFVNAASFIKKPATLVTLVSAIDKLDWYSAREEGLGDLYEGLLAKNANEKKSGAGQYFTPRPLIDSMVAVMRPALSDVIQDPAAGTSGFLIAANHYICKHDDATEWSHAQRRKYRRGTFYGMEHVHDTHRLALMNLMLHGLELSSNGAGVKYGDTLSPDGQQLPRATLILTNPPFGTKKGGGLPTRDDLPFPTSNKQLCFLQHIYGALRRRGRAAVIVPDNVLFEAGIARLVRTDLMNKCNLHTILRLPTGIFYAQGINTNVLFFTRGERDKDNTKEVWVYDLRSNMPSFRKRAIVLTRDTFSEFEHAFGDDPLGSVKSLRKRRDVGEKGRFRRFSRAVIAERGDSLDISWLKDGSDAASYDTMNPQLLAKAAVKELEAATKELRKVIAQLGGKVGR